VQGSPRQYLTFCAGEPVSIKEELQVSAREADAGGAGTTESLFCPHGLPGALGIVWVPLYLSVRNVMPAITQPQANSAVRSEFWGVLRLNVLYCILPAAYHRQISVIFEKS
jgi:hypothetical protein